MGVTVGAAGAASSSALGAKGEEEAHGEAPSRRCALRSRSVARCEGGARDELPSALPLARRAHRREISSCPPTRSSKRNVARSPG